MRLLVRFNPLLSGALILKGEFLPPLSSNELPIPVGLVERPNEGVRSKPLLSGASSGHMLLNPVTDSFPKQQKEEGERDHAGD